MVFIASASRNTVQIRGGPAAVIGDMRCTIVGPLLRFTAAGRPRPHERSESQKTC